MILILSDTLLIIQFRIYRFRVDCDVTCFIYDLWDVNASHKSDIIVNNEFVHFLTATTNISYDNFQQHIHSNESEDKMRCLCVVVFL